MLFIFKRMGVGGAELRTKELVTRYPETRFTFVTTSDARGELDDELLQNGHDLLKLGRSLSAYNRLFSLMRLRDVDVVHSQLGLASGYILALATVARVPVRIAHFRSDSVGGNPSFRKTVGLALSRRLIKMTATVIAGVTPGALHHGWSHSWQTDSRCRVLSNFIDVNRLTTSTTDLAPDLAKPPTIGSIKVCNIGRRERSKRQDLAVLVWAGFAIDQPSTLHLVGSLSESADEQIEQLSDHLKHRVLHHEYVANAGRVLANMSVTLLTSEREGLPGVALESLALGIPLVASDIPGIRWIAQEIKGVHMVPCDASIDEWIASLKIAADDQMADIAQSFAESSFSSQAILAAYASAWLPSSPRPIRKTEAGSY